MTQTAQSEWITLGELAARWRKSRSSIWRMRKTGGIKFYRIGGTVRIKIADVVEYEQKAEAGG